MSHYHCLAFRGDLLRDEAFCNAVHRARTRLVRGPVRIRRPVKGAAKGPRFVKQPRQCDFNQHIIAAQGDVLSHMLDALSAEHPFNSDGNADNPPELLDAVDNVCSLGPGIVQWRRKQFGILRDLSRRVRHLSISLRAMQSASVASIAGGLDLGLMAVLCEALDWPDHQLIFNMVHGFPVVGDIPDSGLFSQGGQKFRKPIDQVLKTNAAWTSRLIDRCKRTATRDPSEDETLLWQKTLSEVDQGLMQGPFGRSHLDDTLYGYGKWRPIARFGVWQKGKLRPCDDARRNFANDITRTAESLTCDGADFPLRMARAFTERLAHIPQMLLGTEDLEAAYRRVPTSQPQYTVVALRDPGTGELKFFTMAGHNFGLLSAVLNFNRVPEFFVHVCRRVLSVCTSHFFDDYPVCEPDFSCGSSQRALVGFHALIGMPLAAKKHVPCAACNDYLGITNDFSEMRQTGLIRVRMTTSRRADLRFRLKEVLDTDSLSPSTAASLHGKLQFALSAMFGKIGRASLILIRQRATRPGSVHSLSDQLRDDLIFLRHLVKVVPDFTAPVRSSARKPLLVWSDAMYAQSSRTGGLGFVVWCPEERRFWHAHRMLDYPELHRLFGERKNYIGPLETLAAVAVLRSMPSRVTRGRMILHSVDNQGALSNLISCSSRDMSAAWLVHDYALTSATLGAGVWFEYVRSAANISDYPSRGELAEYYSCLRALGYHGRSELVDFKYPEAPEWRLP